MKKIFYITFLSAVLAAACTDEPYRSFDDTQVQIESADVTFSALGGTSSIVVAESAPVKVVSNKDWCTTQVNGAEITVTVTPNMSIFNRTAMLTLTVQDKTNYVPVTQLPVYLKFGARTVSVAPEESTAEVVCESDATLTLTPNVAWLSATFDRETQLISIHADPNMSVLPRTGAIVVQTSGLNNGESIKDSIVVNQGARTLQYNEFIGEYTMYYSRMYNTASSLSLDVEFVENEAGKSYYVKGIWEDDNIVVNYSGGILEWSGQELYRNSSYIWWWQPVLDAGFAGTYAPAGYSPVEMTLRTTEIDASGNLSFTFSGAFNGYPLIGFRIYVYSLDGATPIGYYPGADGDYRYYYLSFEKK
jgi:hypothetical protein